MAFEDRLNRVLPDARHAGRRLPPAGDQSLFKVVLGADDRKPAGDTRNYPARVIAQLVTVTRDGAEFAATGCFVAPQTLLTAAHALYIHTDNPQRQGMVREVTVIPGRMGLNGFPFGHYTVGPQNLYVPQQWASASIAHDYALVYVPPLPVDLGVMRTVALNDEQLRGLEVFISGYPLDKPPGTQWYDTRRITAVASTELFYDIDSEIGDSGAPIFAYREGVAYVVGVHRYGTNQRNFGTRITGEVLADIGSRLV